MTDQELNEAVLGSLGWVKERDGHGVKWHKTEPNLICLQVLYRLPDFATDLNAIHDVEWELSQKEKTQYRIELERAHCHLHHGPCGLKYWFEQIHSSARKRAEAFIKAKLIP